MLVVASNINMAPILGMLRDRNPSALDYGQHEISLIDPDSILFKEEVKEILFFMDGDEFVKDTITSFPDPETRELILSRIDSTLSMIDSYLSRRQDVLFIINSITFSPLTMLTYLETNSDYGFSGIEYEINQKLIKFGLAHRNVVVLDWRRIVGTHGYINLHDERFWYLGRIKLNNRALKLLCREFYQLMSAHRGNSGKALLLDLDNTLWGGIIGEDGIGGIELSEDGVGKAYRDFQKAVKGLQNMGVLLCLVSKNNEDDAREVFFEHPMMILKWDDFVVKKINWKNKLQNIAETAEELNLGVDSLLFIDDNPVERELVRENMPEVKVPDFPEDPTLLTRWFMEDVVYPFFGKTRVTKEDLSKTEQYRKNIKRKELQKSVSLDDFVESLDIRLQIHLNPHKHIARLAQLTQKTNQFNMSSRRYTEQDIDGYIKDPQCVVFSLDYEDKFGHEGIIGEAILRISGPEAFIDVFLLSCRIIGRGVEFAFLFSILQYLEGKGVETISAEFVPTKKNDVARNFYKDAGFAETRGNQYSSPVSDMLRSTEDRFSIKEVMNVD